MRAVALAVLGRVAVTATAADAPRRLIVPNAAAWMPYAFLDAEGVPRGGLVDLGRRSLDRVGSGRAHVHGGLTRTRDRVVDLAVSAPIICVKTQLFVRRVRFDGSRAVPCSTSVSR